LRVPPRTTAIGALAYYVSHADARNYQPTNITFGIMAPALDLARAAVSDSRTAPEATGTRRAGKLERKLAISERALHDLDAWIAQAEAGTLHHAP
jgi:methylenetetrahydrofolate--tRNA-(uracil-5-)-methyltransferase